MRRPPPPKPVLSVGRAASLRRVLLGLAAGAGLAAAVAVALVDGAAGYAAEGSASAVGLDGDALRLAIVLGTVVATTMAVQGAGRAAGAMRTALVLFGVALGLTLAGLLLAPMALLVLAAVGVDVLTNVRRR